MLLEGVGQDEQMASTNKYLAQSNKSRSGGKATKSAVMALAPLGLAGH
jgi:hypothetical protein